MITLKIYSDLKTRMTVRKVRFASGSKLTIFGDLGYDTRQMYALGRFGLHLIKSRVARGIGSDDAPMKPLKKGYAIQKTKSGKGNRRNLSFTGDMLRNFTIRSISATQVRMDITSPKQRIKARANEQKSPWFGWSPRDLAQLTVAGRQLFRDNIASIGIGAGAAARRPFASGAIWMNPNELRPAVATGALNAA